MTVIVGIKAKDGAVLVSDGAATYAVNNSGPQTIKQPTRKLSILSQRIGFGASGAVGMAQQYIDACIAWSERNNRKSQKTLFPDHEEFRKFISSELKPLLLRATADAQQRALVGFNPAEISTTSLWMFPTETHGPALVQVSPGLAPEFASTDLPFVSLGSGQPAADPFLAFQRSSVWPSDREPTIPEAVLYALWAVKHTVDVQPGMVSRPFQVVTLRQTNPKDHRQFEFIEKSLEDIECHLQMVDSINDKIKTACREVLELKTNAAVPQRLD